MEKIIVVGAGIIGLSTARELAQRGYSVVVLEKNHTGGEESYAASGVISPLRPWHVHPVVDRLVDKSFTLYEGYIDSLIDETGVDPQFVKSGMLVVGDTHSSAAIDWANSRNHTLESVDRAGLTKLIPDIGRMREGVYLPNIYQVRNPLLHEALLLSCKNLGVEIRAKEEVIRLDDDSQRITGVTTKNDKFCANSVVLAAGAWSESISGSLKLRLNITPVRGQMIWYADQPERARRPIVDDGEHHVVTRLDGVTLVGSVVENVGFDAGVTDKALIKLMNKAKHLILGLGELTPMGQWSGLRPGRVHGIPLIGAHPGVEGLFLNTGHFRNGITLAPVSAQILADVIDGTEGTGVGVNTL